MNILRRENETKKAYIWRCVGNASIAAAIIAAYLYILRRIKILHELVLVEMTRISNQVTYDFYKIMDETIRINKHIIHEFMRK